MREAQYLKQNAKKWQQYKDELVATADADVLANRFIELTDDLAYSRTFYPESKTTQYLNGLATEFHQAIYRNKKEKSSRIIWFWQYELPYMFGKYQKQFLYSFIFFVVFALMGALSAKYDENFVRLILGDEYVNMTLDNIEKGDPFAVYKDESPATMFFFIAFNNIQVAFLMYLFGILFSVGTIWMLLRNGIMMGSFQYFFIAKGYGAKFITVVFIHGTIELWSFVVAGAAGLILGNSILFPGTYKRGESIRRGGKEGLKMVLGLVPFFILAAFFESFVTRHTEMPLAFSIAILVGSLLLIVWYFVIYPLRLNSHMQQVANEIPLTGKNNNFNAWMYKKFSSEK